MKTAAQLRLSGGKRSKIARRKASESPLHSPGVPPRPAGLSWALRRAWNKLCADLLARRVLVQDDGPQLLELLQARADTYRAAGERREAARQRLAALQAIFDARQPFPEPEAPTTENEPRLSLEVFLAEVRLGRETFPARLQPGSTVCFDLVDGQPVPYAWPEGDAASVARAYCLQVTQGGIPACDLLKRACTRHLGDLKTGASRGLFFDPVTARQAVQWFEAFCGLKLEAWEIWLITSLLAWKRPTGMRRFTEAWISMGRKNGKSALLAGLGLWGLLVDGEQRAEVYSAATKKDQAKIIFHDACWYVSANAGLKARLKKYINSLADEETGSTFQPLSSDTRSMDGLRPSFVLADEVHEWDSREQWDKLASGVGSRTQPILIAATTAGAAQVGFAYGKFDIAGKILNGIFPAAETFVGIWELEADDDFRDEKNWVKANPNLGVSVSVESLRKLVADVEQDPAAQNAFLRYQCNRWVTFKAGRSIPADKWDACKSAEGEEGTPKELVTKFVEKAWGGPCWGGFDLGLTEDMSAFVVLFRNTMTQVVTTLAHFWMPEVGLLEKEKRWHVPLSQWAREEWITLVRGDLTDPDVVLRDIADFCQKEGHVHSIGFDAWNAGVMMSKLAERTGVTVYEVPQRPSTITQPAKAFKTAVWQRTFQHLGNPVLKWMAGNVVLEEDEKHGGMMAVKLSPNEKIDGIQALLSAWATMEEDPGWLKNFGRGFTTFP